MTIQPYKKNDTTKKDFGNLCKQNNIKISQVSEFAGFYKKYAYYNYRPCLYYCAICLIAKKKGINLETILNIK